MSEYFLIKIPNVIINAIMRNDFTSKKFQKYFFSSLYALILVLCLSTSFPNTINQNMSMTAIDKNTFKIEKLSIYASMPIFNTLNPANIQTMPAMNKSVPFLTIIHLQMSFISIYPNKIISEHCSYCFKKNTVFPPYFLFLYYFVDRNNRVHIFHTIPNKNFQFIFASVRNLNSVCHSSFLTWF